MTTRNHPPEDTPATPRQLAAAMAALGYYGGTNSDAEHAKEAKRVGGAASYRLLLANALLGCAEAEAVRADSAGVSAAQVQAAHHQALGAAGVAEDPAKLLEFLRWRTLRVAGPLREIAQNAEAGPVPLAAAHAAEALQLLLGVCAAGQDPASVTPEELTGDLQAAREALTNAVANIDIMLRLVRQVEDRFSR